MNDLDYKVPFQFNGTINKVTFNLGPVQLTSDEHQAIRHARAKAND